MIQWELLHLIGCITCQESQEPPSLCGPASSDPSVGSVSLTPASVPCAPSLSCPWGRCVALGRRPEGDGSGLGAWAGKRSPLIRSHGAGSEVPERSVEPLLLRKPPVRDAHNFPVLCNESGVSQRAHPTLRPSPAVLSVPPASAVLLRSHCLLRRFEAHPSLLHREALTAAVSQT